MDPRRPKYVTKVCAKFCAKRGGRMCQSRCSRGRRHRGAFHLRAPPLPVHRMQARIHTPGVVRVPTVGTVVREKYYYPGKSGRVPSRWRIGHVRTEPAIDGRKETFSVRHPLLPPPFVTSAMRFHAFEERRNLAVFRPALYKSRREGKEGGGWRSVFLLELETRAK